MLILTKYTQACTKLVSISFYFNRASYLYTVVFTYNFEAPLGSSSGLIIRYSLVTPKISITLLLSVGIWGRGLPLHTPPQPVDNFGRHFGLGISSLALDIAYGVIMPFPSIYDSSLGSSYSHATAVSCGTGLSSVPM